MKLVPLAIVCAFAIMSAHAAGAACIASAPATHSTTVEAGANVDALTRDRGAWDREALTVFARGSTAQSVYAQVSDERRFGATDPGYGAGATSALLPNLIADAEASFSPTHVNVPENVLGGGFDIRMSHGYGVQTHFEQRNYPMQIAGITTLGADRYVGSDRFSVGVALAHLSGVPGTALSEQVRFARYLACDEEAFSIADGRDVETVGPARGLAVYHAISYDASDVHWISPRFGIVAGVGWNVLLGAYNRLEVRLAVRRRY